MDRHLLPGLALLAAVFLAAPAGAIERTDGSAAGSRMAWDALTGGGGVSTNTADNLRIEGALLADQATTSASPDGSFVMASGAVTAGASVSPLVIGNPPNDGAFAATRPSPVPYKPAVDMDGIRFFGLPGSGTIKVFTLGGDLVRTLRYPESNLPFSWNPVTDEAGEVLASNAYIYLVESAGQKKLGQLMVVR